MTALLLAASLSTGNCQQEPVKNVDTIRQQSSNSTNASTATDSSKPPDRSPFQAIEDRTDESPSIMSRIASWWPFGSSDNSNSNIKLSDKLVDSAVAEDHQLSGQYLPAPSGYGGRPHRPSCHPCNQEPWIPVAANYGHNTIIGFVQQPPPQYGPPSQQYGPPHGLVDDLGPPPSHPGHSPSGFGPPNIGPIYGPPKPIYGPPKPQHKPHYAPKLPKLHYGPPKPNYGPPPKPQYGPPKPQYGPPKPAYGPPPGKHNNHHDGPNLNAYLSPPSGNFGGGHKFKPKFNQGLGSNYGPPLDLFGPPQKYGPPRPFISPPQQNYGPPIINQQYGAPLSLDVQPSIEILGGQLNLGHTAHAHPPVTDPEYLPPKEHQELPLANGPNDFLDQQLPPIPLPNLSSAPIAPIYEPQPFRQQIDNSHFSSQHYDNHYDNSQSFEIQQSVPIADYIASIEHPINVIQSPITDLNVAVHPGANLEPQNYEDGYDYAGSLSGEDNSGQYSYKANVRLSDHPIVVADINSPAASTKNETVLNPNYFEGSKKRGNDKDLRISFFHPDLPKVTPQYINQIASEIKRPPFKDINDNSIGFTNHGKNKPAQFILPTPGYVSWNPTLHYNTISTSSMVPPPKGATTWLSTVATAKPLEVTKKPKQIQIIIPYTTNNNGKSYSNPVGRENLPIHTQPPETASVWTQHAKTSAANTEKLVYTQKPPTTSGIINIKELLVDSQSKHINGHSYSDLPFDIVRLQKNIDGWTEQEYANTMKLAQKHAVTSRYVTAKKIPDNFFTTLPYDDNELTTLKPTAQFFDHEPAGSNNKESKSKFINDEIENNFIVTEATAASTDDYYDSTTDYVTSSPAGETWEKLQVSVSPITKEKIYVVTPQSIATGKVLPTKEFDIGGNVSYATHRFAVKINSEESNSTSSEFEDDVKVVLSEWPHIINNLETTSSTSSTTASSRTTLQTTRASSSTSVSSTLRRHPLFGLIDLSAYTTRPPATGGATIQTYSGHSKVVSSSSSGTTKVHFPTSTTLGKSSSATTKQPIIKS